MQLDRPAQPGSHLKNYKEALLFGLDVRDANASRKEWSHHFRPLDKWIVHPATRFLTDRVTFPALEKIFLFAGDHGTRALAWSQGSDSATLRARLSDPFTTEQLQAFCNKVERATSSWGRRRPSQNYFLIYTDTCTVVAAKYISTMAKDGAALLTLPETARSLTAQIQIAAQEEIIDAIARDLVHTTNRLTAAAPPEVPAIEGPSEAPPSLEIMPHGSAPPAPSPPDDGGGWTSTVLGAVRATRNLWPQAERLLGQYETTREWAGTLGDYRHYVEAGGRVADALSYGPPVDLSSPATYTSLATAAAVGFGTKFARQAAEEQLEALRIAADEQINEGEKLARQKLVAEVTSRICKQALEVLTSQLLRFCTGWAFFKLLSMSIIIIVPHADGEGFEQMAWVTSLCITAAMALLWYDMFSKTASRLYTSYAEEEEPEGSTFSELQSYVSQETLDSMVLGVQERFGGFIPASLVSNPYLNNFATRVRDLKLDATSDEGSQSPLVEEVD